MVLGVTHSDISLILEENTQRRAALENSVVVAVVCSSLEQSEKHHPHSKAGETGEAGGWWLGWEADSGKEGFTQLICSSAGAQLSLDLRLPRRTFQVTQCLTQLFHPDPQLVLALDSQNFCSTGP